MSTSTRSAYDERLSVPLRWWVQGVMLVAMVWITLIVALPEPTAWALTAAAGGLLALAYLAYGSARITVADGRLRAGRARIPAAHLGTAVPLSPEDARRVAGVDADPRAYLLLRPYVKPAVKVEILDPADPAPYWLLSTRHPAALARALNALER